MILFVPFLLLTIPLGTLLGGVPAALVAALAFLFMDGTTPWILGALASLPVFIVVMISPLLFLNGLVEIYLSPIWTLAYWDLKGIQPTNQASTSDVQVLLT